MPSINDGRGRAPPLRMVYRWVFRRAACPQAAARYPAAPSTAGHTGPALRSAIGGRFIASLCEGDGSYSGIAAEIDTKNMPLAYFLNVSTPACFLNAPTEGENKNLSFSPPVSLALASLLSEPPAPTEVYRTRCPALSFRTSDRRHWCGNPSPPTSAFGIGTSRERIA